ncbi:TetR/AcrR family transcriptional regulator [Nocardioides sp. AE5]|uniref:TetR/AcrR family transcriptional regulator n=1 Tax=Nocardioides sp. AE5 TaxID=2962573 RepID=UPI0028824A13|nr:TetR/AcrR family transcriptional regulator [Nocardioides sp. AE5]MDT0203061.1 TetR/AcrR family transcriptional regulator [Nocardioides sp. AE5]
MAEVSGKQRKRVRDPQAARKALLQAGVELFEKQGYAGTSVQSIVDSAGLTKGAFYHHFSCKDDLLRRVHDEFIDYQLSKARAVMSEPGVPTDERLRHMIKDALLEPMGRYKAEITVFLQERRFLSSDMFGDIQRKREEFERYFVDLIEHGMAEGVFRKIGPARVVAFGIIGTGAWTHTWLHLDGSMSPTEIGDMFAEMLVGGLITRD